MKMNYIDALLYIAFIITVVLALAICAIKSLFYKKASKAPPINGIDQRTEETIIAIPEININKIHHTIKDVNLQEANTKPNVNSEIIRPPGSLKGCYSGNLKRQSAITMDEFLIPEIKNSLRVERSYNDEVTDTIQNQDIHESSETKNLTLLLKDTRKIERGVCLRRSNDLGNKTTQLKFLLDLNDDSDILKINLMALTNVTQILNEKPIEKRRYSKILMDEQRGKLKRFLSSRDLSKCESLDMGYSKRFKIKISVETKFTDSMSLRGKMSRRVSLMTKNLLHSSSVDYFKTNSLDVDVSNQQACKYVKINQVYSCYFKRSTQDQTPEFFIIKFCLHDDDLKVKLGKFEIEVSHLIFKYKQSQVFIKEFKRSEEKSNKESQCFDSQLDLKGSPHFNSSIHVSLNLDTLIQKFTLILSKIKIPMTDMIKTQSK